MSMMRRRIIAVVAAALALVILGFSLAAVLKYVAITEIVDVDGKTKYYAINKDGSYKLYDSIKGENVLPIDKEYGYYVTPACGTLIQIDKKTGEETDRIAVDDVYRPTDSENIGRNNRVLIFPHIDGDHILSLEVHNPSGSYTFEKVNADGEKSKDGNFVIKNAPLAGINYELFSKLYVSAGYTITLLRLEDPMKGTDGKIDLKEYGLVAEEREKTVVDEDTGEERVEKYNYEPAYYVLEEISGKKHKLIIGDMLVTEGGYYVQYVDMTDGVEKRRDAIYVLSTSIGETVLAPIETYVVPTICHPMGMSTYVNVDEFTILNRQYDEYINGTYNDEAYEKLYKRIINFSYIDDRTNASTAGGVTPYRFNYDLEGYPPSDAMISASLYKLYAPSIIGAQKLKPSEKDLVDYGFMTEIRDKNGNVVTNEKGEVQYVPFAKYVLSYDYDVLDETNSKVDYTIHQIIMISDRDHEEKGTYYTYSLLYNVGKDKNGNRVTTLVPDYFPFIAEVEGYMFDFVEFDEYDWVNANYFDQNIAFLKEIKITTPSYSAMFGANNSLTKQNDEQAAASDMLYAWGSDSRGNSFNSFGSMEIVVQKEKFVVTTAGLNLYSTITGNKKEIYKDVVKYEYNDIGNQCKCLTKPVTEIDSLTINGEKIDGAKGASVEINANDIVVTFKDGTRKVYTRYDTEIFRKFYQTFLYASLIGRYEMTEEEEAALINDPSKLLMTLEITIRDAESKNYEETTTVYKFYRLSSRKAYITVNGNGGFYVYTNRVNKFVTDAQKAIDCKPIDPTAKN